jgi:hypothetical protein
MTEEQVAVFRQCRYGVSRMVFRTNLNDARQIEIPLASFVDLTVGAGGVFGCAARGELTAAEIAALPESWRDTLNQPNAYLYPFFLDAAKNVGLDGRFTFLSEKFSASLYVQPVQWLPRPAAFAQAVPDAIVLNDLAAPIVLEKLREEEATFLKPPASYSLDPYGPAKAA